MRRLVVLALVGCGGDPVEGSQDAPPETTDSDDVVGPADSDVDSDAPDTVVADTDSDVATTCPAGALAPGNYELRVPHDGRQRRYLLHVPPAHDGTAAVPLMVSFAGWLDSPEKHRSRTRLSPHADAHGYLVAYPEGIDDSWDGGACCGTATSDHPDDVGFAKAVVADIAARACVDPQRVYATGFSNGAFLVHRLACEAGDVFAAGAAVSGMMTFDPDTCDRGHVVPLIHLHGTIDVVVPYVGNPIFDYPTFDDSVAVWTELHGCDAPKATDRFPKAHCDTWAGCADGAEVRACTLDNWPHEWPGATSPLPANDEIWAFLTRWTRDSP